MQSIIERLKKHGINTDTFCFAPYVNVDLDQSGEVYSCYRGKDPLSNWKELPLDVEFNNENYRNLRQGLFNGQKSSNCNACWDAEEHNSASPRQMFLEQMSKYSDDTIEEVISSIKNNPKQGNIKDLIRGEIRTSSLCNLKCLHCGPHSSTQWIAQLKDKEIFDTFKETVGGLDSTITNENIHEVFKHTLNSISPYTTNIKKVLSNTKILQFAGGEPLMDPDHLSWLDYFVNVSKTSKEISLHYNTNLNINNIEKYFEHWKQFNNVIIRISIDSSPSSYEYFRRGGDIFLIETNIKKIQKEFGNKITLQGSITFNMFAAMEWKEITHWWNVHNLDFHTSLVRKHPTSAIYLPDDIKRECQEEMQWCIDNIYAFVESNLHKEKFIDYTNDCMNYMMNSTKIGNCMSEKSISYLKMLDRKSNLNMLTYYPRLKEYYK